MQSDRSPGTPHRPTALQYIFVQQDLLHFTTLSEILARPLSIDVTATFRLYIFPTSTHFVPFTFSVRPDLSCSLYSRSVGFSPTNARLDTFFASLFKIPSEIPARGRFQVLICRRCPYTSQNILKYFSPFVFLYIPYLCIVSKERMSHRCRSTL